ncbi:MAG: hypothetical protein HC912_06595 [Saprospiraceae bacterium]|nr:hypothetical protein [Saprospiraceae bacterium]
MQEEDTISRKTSSFQPTKKILLEADSLFPNITTAMYGIIDQLPIGYGLIAPNLKLFLAYDTPGALIRVVGRGAIKEDFRLPEGYFPSAFHWYQDTLRLLYPNNQLYTIYEQEVVSVLSLKLPAGVTITRGSPLLYHPQRNLVMLSCGKDYAKGKDFLHTTNR